MGGRNRNNQNSGFRQTDKNAERVLRSGKVGTITKLLKVTHSKWLSVL